MTGTMRMRPGCLTAITRPRRKTTPCSYCLTMRNESDKPINANAPTVTITTSTAMVGSFLDIEIGARVTALPSRRRDQPPLRDGHRSLERGIGEYHAL